MSVIKGVKGVKDLLPEETPRWRLIEESARRWATRYGFHEIRIPIFEVITLFARSIGASADIVEKEMYTFPDRDGTSLTLRPEGTAGTVRSYIEHNRAAIPVPQKYFYTGPMFRHERPQAGRLRQFHQFGVESYGIADPRADVEVIALLWHILHELGLPSLTLEINNLGQAADRDLYVLEALGVKIEGAPRVAARCIEETGFGFLFAPRYHPTLRKLAPLRRELGFRSIFNLVGPLAHPDRVRLQVMGVPALDICARWPRLLRALGVERALVVHGLDGSDEISLVGPTSACELRGDGLREIEIHPEEAGLALCRAADLRGGDPEENATIANQILDGARGPVHDYVVLNAPAALMVGGRAATLREGAELAREALISRKAHAVLQGLRRITGEAA